MKKQTNIILVLSATFSYLFYQQAAGINMPIFALVMTVTYAILKPELLKNRLWIVASLSLLLSSVIVVVEHTALSIQVYVLSYVLQAGLFTMPQLSGITATVNGGVSIMLGFLQDVIGKLSGSDDNKPPHESESSFTKRISKAIIVMGIMLVFFVVYYAASPGFNKLVNNIELDFISWGFISFMFLGVLIITGTFKGFSLQGNLADFEEVHPDQLTRKRNKSKIAHALSKFKFEYSTGVLLMVGLNTLLLVVNISDIINIANPVEQITSGLRSAHVHQGVNALIISIVMAISVLLYFFRGNINFYSKNNTLKMLAYVWVWLNVILALTVVQRNMLYVHDYGLTYKRIGVFVYIFLALLGLMSTYFKISKKQSIWRLIKTNAAYAYYLMVIMSIFNWDAIITKYNLTYPDTTEKSYLLTLSDNNLPILNEIAINSNVLDDFIKELVYKNEVFMDRKGGKTDWQEWNYRDKQIYQNAKASLEKLRIKAGYDQPVVQ